MLLLHDKEGNGNGKPGENCLNPVSRLFGESDFYSYEKPDFTEGFF